MSDPNFEEIAAAGLEKWGTIPQMLMVAEEAVELAHAVLKWRRRYVAVIRSNQADQSQLEEAEEAVILEAIQVQLMLETLPRVLPQSGRYWAEVKNEVAFDAKTRIGMI